MPATIELTLHLPDHLHEFLIAELADRGFDGFVQEDDRLLAYVPAPAWNDVAREWLERWLLRYDAGAPAAERVVEEQNWNAAWEAGLEPQAVGRFWIAPTWADAQPEPQQIPLRIDPKMSFGTGYHASTRLVLRALPGLVAGGERVLDAGSGTGLLAIAAVKLGAASAIAFDVDPWAFENAAENVARNGVDDRVDVRRGTVAVVPEEAFDLVLANINRNALLGLLLAFAGKTRPGGALVLAGLLRSDRAAMLDAAGGHGFELQAEQTEGDWWSGTFRFRVADAE